MGVKKANLGRGDSGVLQFHRGSFLATEDYNVLSLHSNSACTFDLVRMLNLVTFRPRTAFNSLKGVFDLKDMTVRANTQYELLLVLIITNASSHT